MVSEIAGLLTERPEHYRLLREFHRFVRPHHKKMFNQLCADLNGEGPPEAQRPPQQDAQGPPDCDRKLPPDPSPQNDAETPGVLCDTNGDPHTVTPATQQQERPLGPTHGDAPAGGSGRGPAGQEGRSQLTAYLNQVTEALGLSNYQRFFSALSSYKKTDDYSAMVSEIAGLLTERPEHYRLLREFHRFVRPHHKKMFNQLCEDLNGEGPPEAQRPPQQDAQGPPQQDAQGPPDCDRKLPPDPSPQNEAETPGVLCDTNRDPHTVTPAAQQQETPQGPTHGEVSAPPAARVQSKISSFLRSPPDQTQRVQKPPRVNEARTVPGSHHPPLPYTPKSGRSKSGKGPA
ncbi:hypothetical protein FKM82_007674 [Ascaphus truei]